MNAQSPSLTHRTKLFGQSLFFSALSMVLTSHLKRLIFITSLYCYVENLDSMREEALAKLNVAMPLARTGNALKLPAAMRNLVWRETNVESVLDHQDLEEDITDQQVARKAIEIVRLSPGWIRYSPDAMVRDIQNLIKRGSYLTSGRPAFPYVA